MDVRGAALKWVGLGLMAAGVALAAVLAISHRDLRVELSNSYTLDAPGPGEVEHLFLFRNGTYKTLLDEPLVDDYGWSQEGSWTVQGSEVTLHPVTVDKAGPNEIVHYWKEERMHTDRKERMAKLFADRKLSLASSKPPYWLKLETTEYEDLFVKELLAKSDRIFRHYSK